MTPTIVHVTAATPREWQLFWEQCPTSTYFHSPEWAQIWTTYAGGRIRPEPKLVYFSDGAQALLPLCFEVKAGGLLSRYASSTQATYGGWLSRQPLHITHAARLVHWLTRGHGRSLVWRLNPYDELAFRAGVLEGLECKKDETHALRLPERDEALMRGFKSSYRTQIRKAARSGFSISEATTEGEWREYFSVYQDSLARWGDAPDAGYGWRLFETMFRLRSPNIKLWLARHEGRVVSGDLCLYAQKHVSYWHGSTLESQLKSGVAKLVKYEVMKDAVRRGLAWYDFNPSAGLSGVKFFKEGFNAVALPAPVVYVDTPLKRLARSCAASVQFDYARLSLQPLSELIEQRPAS